MTTVVIGRRRFLVAGLGLSVAALAQQQAPTQATFSTIPIYTVPTLSPPLANAVEQGWMVWNPTPLDYVVEERLMSGVAPVYKPITENDFNFPPAPAGTEPLIDPIGPMWAEGRIPPPPDPFDFSARPILSTGPYVTRLVVYRPRDMRRFSGNVIIETIHPSNGGSMTIFAMMNRFYADRGDIVVGVQHPITLPLIKFHHPERYGAVMTSDYSQIWGMLADTARLFKDGGAAGVVRERARHVYLTGYSFTGLIVTTFAKRHHAVNRMPDGKPLFDGYVGGTGEGPMPPLDVPVLLAANQHSSYPAKDVAGRSDFNADGLMSRRRRYEIVGFQHTPVGNVGPGGAIAPPSSSERERSCASQYPKDAIRNPNTLATPILEGMFHNISEWVERGIAPPRAPVIDSENGRAKVDSLGNALGGVRTPEITVALGTYGIGFDQCASTGWMVPFTQEQLRKLYGSRSAYLKLYGEATDALVAQRFILPRTATRMKTAIAQRAPAF